MRTQIYTVWGGFTNNNSTATLFNNSVTIANAGKQFDASIISGAYSAATSASTLYNNSVNMSGGTFVSNSTGGTLNALYITGAYIMPTQWREVDVDTGGLDTPAGTTVNMKAYDNTVTITDGEIKGTVAGAAIIVSATTTASITYNGSISNNTVNIYGGIIINTAVTNTSFYNGIYGGVYQGKNDGTLVHNYSVTNNTVNIGFDAKVEDKVNIGGGAFNDLGPTEPRYFNLTPNANTYDGNTLNLYHLTGSTVKAGTVANFENINFVLGAGDSSQFASDAVLTATTLYIGNGYSTQAGVNTALSDGSTTATLATKYANFGLHTSLYNTLATGQTIQVLTAKDGIDGNFTNLGANNSGTYTGTHGALLSRTWDIQTNTDTITAKLLSTQAGEQSKILGEVSLANMTAITNSTDLLVGSAIPSAYQQISSKQEQSTDSSQAIDNSAAAAFMVTSGGSSRYNTGSHVDSNSISLNAGIAKGITGMSGNWLVGGFFEYNYGSYSTYNSFSTGTAEGDGEVYAYGVGGFVRYDFEHAEYKPYVEASMRIGYIETEYASNDLYNFSASLSPVSFSYDTDNMYMSMHLGVGNIFEINDKLSIDASLKYFWTHQSSENRNLFGHNVEFDAVNSHRLRLNTRTNYTLKDDDVACKLAMYGGLGLEYEFDGKARSYIDGYEAPTPDLQGLTGLGEFGLSFTPSVNSNVSIDLGMQAFTGMREGVSGNLQFVFKF